VTLEYFPILHKIFDYIAPNFCGNSPGEKQVTKTVFTLMRKRGGPWNIHRFHMVNSAVPIYI